MAINTKKIRLKVYNMGIHMYDEYFNSVEEAEKWAKELIKYSHATSLDYTIEKTYA